MSDRRNAVAEVRLQLNTMLDQFAAVLPAHIPVERFGRVVLTAVQTNPDLLSVDRRSLWNACMRAAQDGLLPDGREGALVVFKDRKKNIERAQWLPMIAGIRKKVRNSGEIATWDVHVAHERDLFEYELGDMPYIKHRPVRGDRGPIIAAYSVATLKTGERSRDVMFVDEIHEIRQRSKMPDSGPWLSDFGEMCKKTVAKRHSKVLPMSTDLDDLLRRDDDDAGGLAEPVGRPRREPGRTLTDALNMVAALPEHSSGIAAQGDARSLEGFDREPAEFIEEHDQEPAQGDAEAAHDVR